jgi:hypothetical protein
MTVFYVKIQHTATGTVFDQPVLADSRAQAESKAGQYPYSTLAYTVLRDEPPHDPYCPANYGCACYCDRTTLD